MKWLKQLFCRHDGAIITYNINPSLVTARTECTDCGKPLKITRDMIEECGRLFAEANMSKYQYMQQPMDNQYANTH